MPAPPKPSALLATLLLALAVGCGGTSTPEGPTEAEQVEACRAQWRDVGLTIVDMDTDPLPSGLAQRWSSIMAGVDFKAQNPGSTCVLEIEQQVRAIDTLRKYAARLQPYDMEYQLMQVRSAINLYLHDPLPGRYEDDNGEKVTPPRKPAVRRALEVLERNAATANAELRPAWDQASTIDLTSADQIRTSIKDIDRLASSSLAFQKCEQVLQVLVAAIRAQQAA